MSGKVIKFLKSLVSSEPTASRAVAKASELSQSPTPEASPSASPSHSQPSNVQTVKPHVPLIKFRKGGPVSGHSVISGIPSPGVAGGRAVASRGTIEDYQLPPRYHRSPLDEKEIDYINRGGPE